MRSEAILLLTLIALVSAGRSRRSPPAVCNLPRDSGSCGGDIEGYYFNTQTGRCEVFRYGGCGGNGNHFSSERACARACECRGNLPPPPRGLVRANSSFCDRTCPQSCDCSGDTVKCTGPLNLIPQGISPCAKTIDLSNTGVQFVQEGAFAGLAGATRLDLSGNDLRCLPENAFEGLTSLETLRLGRNQLLQIPANVLQTLPSLQRVELQNNMLTVMACETIDNLPDLKLVNISNNQLKRLIPHPGTPLGQMTIDVSGNELSSFNVPLVPGSDGPTLLLRDNPWVCDCRLRQIIAHYARRQDQVLDRIFAICSKPSSVANQPLLLTNPDSMECLPRQPDTVRIIDICQLAADAGPCLAGQTRYFYDPNRRSCRQFTYGGCLGNENNFASAESCERHCVDIASRPSDEPVTMVLDITTQPACGANEEFQDCGTSCEDTCAEPAQFCLEFCVKGCFCREGYIRQNENGRCIREEECESLDPETPTGSGDREPQTASVVPALPRPVWDRNPAMPSTQQIDLFLPPYDIPGAVYDVVYQQRPNGPLIPAGTAETDSRDPVPFTISGLQPGTPYHVFISARVGPRRSGRSRLDTQTTDDAPTQSSTPDSPVWPQPNNPSNVLPKQFTLRLPSNQPSSVVYDVIDSDAGRIVSTYPSNSRRTQTFPARPSQVYRYGIRARYSISGQMSPVTSELLLLTPPEWPQPGNPVDVQPDSITVRLPADERDITYEVIDQDTTLRVDTYQPGSSRLQQLSVIPEHTYRLGIRSRDRTGLVSPIVSVITARTPVLPTEAPLPQPVWTQRGSPSQRFVELSLPPYQVPNSVYTVYYESDRTSRQSAGTGQPGNPFRVTGLDPGTEYRFFVVARNNGRTSPESDPLPERTKEISTQPTQEVVTQTRHNRYMVTWTISPSLEPIVESFMIQYRPVRPDGTVGSRVVADPAVPKEDRTYDLSFPGGGKYQIEVLAQPLDLQFFKAIVDIDGAVISPDKDKSQSPSQQSRTPHPRTLQPTMPRPTTQRPGQPPTTQPPTMARSTQQQTKQPRPTTSRPTTSQPTMSRLTTPEPTASQPTTSQLTTSRPTTSRPTTSRPTMSRPTTSRPTTSRPTTSRPTTSRPTTSRPTTSRPTTSRPTTSRSKIPQQTTPQTTTERPTTPRSLTPPGPTSVQQYDWPVPGYSVVDTTESSTILFLPGIPGHPPFTFFDVEYRTPGGAWTYLAGRLPVNSRPQQFKLSSLVRDTQYDFRFRYTQPGSPPTNFSESQTIRTLAAPPTPDAPEWPQPNNPSDFQPDTVTVTLPSGQPFDVVYEVVDRDAVIGTFHSSSPRRQQLPVRPGQLYRFGIRARNLRTDLGSSVLSVLQFSTLRAQPTQEVVTQTRHNHYIVTWMISPLLESYFESFRIQYRPIRPDGTVGPRVVADPAVPKEDRTYDLSFPVGGKYQIEVLTQPLDLEVFKAIVDIDGAVISPDKDKSQSPSQQSPTSHPRTLQPTMPRPTTQRPAQPPTTQPPTMARSTQQQTTQPRPTTSRPTSKPTMSQPTMSRLTTPQLRASQPTTPQLTVSQPATSRPTTSQPTIPQPTTSRPTTSRPTTSRPTSRPTTSRPTTSRPTTSQPTMSRPTTSRPTTSRSKIPQQTTPQTTTERPTTPRSLTPPGPTSVQQYDWPVPGYSVVDTTESSTILFLPGIPGHPPFTFFDVEYRTPGGAWTYLAGRLPVNSRPQQFKLSSLVRDTQYDFRFRYTQPGSPPSDFSGPQTIRTLAVPDAPVWPLLHNPSNIQPNSVTVTLPSGQPSNVVYEVIDTNTGRVLGSYPANSPRQQQFPVNPDQVYRFGIRARDPSTDLTSPTSSVLTFRSASLQQFDWPEPGYSLVETLDTSTVLFLPGIPNQPESTFFDVEYRTPGGAWTHLAGGLPVNSQPQQFELSGLVRDTQYDFRFRYTQPGSPPSNFSESQTIRTLAAPPTPDAPVWPEPNNPSDFQPDTVTFTLPSGQPFDVVYEVVDRDAVIGTFHSSSPRRQQLPVRPGQLYRFGIRARNLRTNLYSSVLSVLQFSTLRAPDAPVWPLLNNPSNIQSNSATATLPSGQPSNVVYEVIDTNTGRVLGSYPANSPRQQQFPLSPDQVYRFSIRARDPSTGLTSPASSVLAFRSAPEPTDSPSLVTFPSQAVWPENPLAHVSREEFMITLPAILHTSMYDIFELVGGSYIRLRTAPGNGSPQQFTFTYKPNQSVLFRIFNIFTRQSTQLSVLLATDK